MIEVGVDNDILLKCCLLGVSAALPAAVGVPEDSFGVLGAARFVVAKSISKYLDQVAAAAATDQLLALLEIFGTLEPTSDEASLAAELELIALRQGLPFDTGESQLFAILVLRPLARLLTGDKRAISSYPALVAQCPKLDAAKKRVLCLEQLVIELVRLGAHTEIRAALVAYPTIDKTLAICFSIRSPNTTSEETVLALTSYAEDVRRSSGELLAD